jgi:parallel beta-helix repeat protein
MRAADDITRRGVLRAASGLLAGAALARRVFADERPPVTQPRATSGDARVEPDWDRRLTITVGPAQADLVGRDDKVIQAGVDYVARLGGGTVRILPGTYALRNAVYLRSGIRLVGSGTDSVLLKNPSKTLALAEDADWYDQEITLADADGVRIGDGVFLKNGNDTAKRTLVARAGNRFKLDRALRKNFWIKQSPQVATLFPLLSGENIADVVIENLTLDGNRAENDNLNGNYGGCVFLQDCNRFTMRGLTTRNYNGDGVSWQICHDCVVENCHSYDNADLGLHPGSGSQRPLIRGNTVQRNRIGIFYCWGVKYSLAEKNTLEENTFGISIGHNDTDNLIRNNVIRDSGTNGVLFRTDDRGKDFWPNRNTLEDNRIFDNGDDEGVAIDIQGQTRSITLARNEVRETRAPMRRTGIKIGPETRDIQLIDNRIDGFAVPVADLRKA